MLVDPFGRQIDYLRVSVTDRCDMRCSYCMPVGFKGFEEPASWLSTGELVRLVGIFVRLGVSKVRLTGGEPLLRRGITDIAQGIANLPGVKDLSLSTNGVHLKRFAKELRHAGVRRLNVSLDTLDAEKFHAITHRDVLHSVLEGIEVAKAEGFERIKLNAVVQPGVNDHELDGLIDYARSHSLTLRLIEQMPIGSTGRATTPFDLTKRVTQLAQRHGLHAYMGGVGNGPARYWRSADGEFLLGAITPLSQHFCETCNRVRLTVDGLLLLCLGQEDSEHLGHQVRAGASDAQLEEAVRAAIARKPERHEFKERPAKVVRFMSATGG